MAAFSDRTTITARRETDRTTITAHRETDHTIIIVHKATEMEEAEEMVEDSIRN